MKRILTFFIFISIIGSGFSQSKKLWKGYFSYREIKDLAVAPNKVIAATENALFSKDVLNGAVKTTNTIDGLSGQTITAIYHSELSQKTIIGYQNGLITVINDTDGKMTNIVGIITKAIPDNIKKINHFLEYEGIAYVSCDFGIVQLNLATLQFGDTYFIGDAGAQIAISQTAVYQNKIYAATAINGIRVADINNANLNDYTQWTRLDGNGWIGVQNFGNEFIAVSNTGEFFRFQGANFVPIIRLSLIVDVRVSGNYLLLTAADKIYIYNANLSLFRTINKTEILDLEVDFSSAAIVADKIYIGTTAHGLFVTSMTGSEFENLTPDGPVKNNIFSTTIAPDGLWAVYGGYNKDYNPDAYFGFTPAKFSVSKLKNNGWLEIPYKDLLGAKALVRIAVNPTNPNLVYISSFDSGLLKIENEIPAILYNPSNSPLEAVGPGASSVRIDGTAFDKDGHLWVTNSLSKNGLKVLRSNGQWQSYDMSTVYTNLGAFNMGRMTIDKNGTKWIGTRDEGIIGFNETYNALPKAIKDDDAGMPANYSRIAVMDKRNQLWIGTQKGLRVLSSVDSFLSDQELIVESIIIKEEEFEELLYEQAVMDIVVDGANNKWIATDGGGVLYVSSDGQKTIYHFTTQNSPLPSDYINDIEINGTTGEVFFATTKGMISFNGISTSANENLNNVFIYPNPVRPEFSGTVKISGLMDKANVKIADIEGNLVYETFAEGGTIEWDTTAFGKHKVASGVYMVLISSEDGIETKVKKVMIVR